MTDLDKHLKAQHYQLAEDNKLLLKALELACAEINYGKIDSKEYFLEKAKEHVEKTEKI